MNPKSSTLQNVINSAPKTLDLTNESHLDQVLQAADTILTEYNNPASLDKIEKELIAQAGDVPLLVHLAVKLAKSKAMIAGMDAPVHTSVVFAVFKERNRIRSKAEHPHGENILIRKIAQLRLLFDSFPGFTWDLTIVDDGCPEGSGGILQEIHRTQCRDAPVRVLFLEEGIEREFPVTKPLTSTEDSKKGGAIQYGLWTVAQQTSENHIIVFTDADLSTHLGQTGLLMDGILDQGKDAAIGSRRERTSVVVKKGLRNMRGKLFIYLWKRLIPNLNYIVDTQCGFKAFKADTVRAIIDGLIEKQFAFDIELLLKTELRNPDSIVKVPVAWIDSDAASTTTDLQPYLPMLKSIAAMYRKYLPPNPVSEQFAAFIEALDDKDWNRLLENIPSEITSREPLEFSGFSGVQVADFEGILVRVSV
jgi:hypothetical protein